MDSKKADAAIANDFARCYICQKLSECSKKVFIQSNMLLELLYVSWLEILDRWFIRTKDIQTGLLFSSFTNLYMMPLYTYPCLQL